MGGKTMKVLNVKENEDGSANMEIEMIPEEVEIFLEYAIVDILKKTVQNKMNKGEDNDGQ